MPPEVDSVTLCFGPLSDPANQAEASSLFPLTFISRERIDKAFRQPRETLGPGSELSIASRYFLDRTRSLSFRLTKKKGCLAHEQEY